ncbi:MAG: TIR domain-containing protein [Bryobacterales bacterium]|jgi:hypothetical protein|nr:TIR domain-containing protein [Bryobacterales bacterium]
MRVLEDNEVRQLLFPDATPTSIEAKLELLLRDTLAREGSLCLGGVGAFRLLANGRIAFDPWTRKKIFVAYVLEDRKAAQAIFHFLCQQNFAPWMDSECLLPGQDWPRAIERAIEAADFVVPCFSSTACRKRSHFHEELRLALDTARRVPLDAPFLVPVRLDACSVPRRIQQHTQYVDLFPDFQHGLRQLLDTLAP